MKALQCNFDDADNLCMLGIRNWLGSQQGNTSDAAMVLPVAEHPGWPTVRNGS
jgi:hypothetical protein